MSTDLNNTLGDKLSSGQTMLVVTSHDSYGDFILHNYISNSVRQQSPLVVLSLGQTFTHYSTIGQKLGANLTQAKEQGTLQFIDGLELIREAFDSDDIEQHPMNFLFEKGVKSLYLEVKSRLGGLVKPLLILDDLSLLRSAGLEVKDVVCFVRYCQGVVCGQGGRLILGVRDIWEEKGDLVQWLWYMADCVVEVKGLASGFSKEVHGQLSVDWLTRGTGDGSGGNLGLNKQEVFHFKVEDKNVHLCAPGTSKAVL